MNHMWDFHNGRNAFQTLDRYLLAYNARYGEAQSGESRKDFIHKMKISLKELRESQVNLQILAEAKLVRDQEN